MEPATGGRPVMAIGGFRGTDPAPSLAEFEKLVAAHRIHYYGRCDGCLREIMWITAFLSSGHGSRRLR
jgi:hypothetical protein